MSFVAFGIISLLLIAVAGLFAWFANVNYIGLHRYYRDRILEAFLQTRAERQAHPGRNKSAV